jgi:chloramphenicol-sensitive protein RarD
LSHPQTRSGAGLLFGLGAYGLWGLFPAFFPLLLPSGAIEVLAHRIVWTAVFMAVVLALTGAPPQLRHLDARTWAQLGVAAVLISINWGSYIWAVNNGHVTDAALGYFINPLFSVVLGVLLFAERLNRAQWAALGIAVVAVLIIAVEAGSPPWVALTVAGSFGLYGAVKKVVPVDPTISVGVEAALMTPVALGYLAFLVHDGGTTFTTLGAGHVVLTLLSGPVTAIPLLCFAAAAQRLPLVTLGLLMYLTPAMAMTWGIVVGHEVMSPARWAGFALIWVALAVFSADAVRRARTR